MGAIRGAICAQNTIDDISSKAVELIAEIIAQNNLSYDDIESIVFTATGDLNACYPAKSVREHFNMPQIAYMCLAEMDVEGGLDHCIRVLVYAPTIMQKNCKHCYLGRAKCLRQDL